jgi:Putative prokaryotic signal transducing protein
MGLMKVFSGSEILAVALQEKIEAAGVATVMKNNIQSARMAGFGETGQAVELFIQETDFAKANPVIEEFRMSI